MNRYQLMGDFIRLKRSHPKEIERFLRCLPFYVITDEELSQFLEDEKKKQTCYTKNNYE
ncbi:MAG: hypothetical protein PUF50_04495 [Erysipelotrichaceae bacterium]|nr:hypothetical protein [Erysipelotrichaceae bacterium]